MSKSAKRVKNWGDIDPKVFDAFQAAVERLQKEMIPVDVDGDSPLNVIVVNRMNRETLPYYPVPDREVYSYITHDYMEVHPDRQAELDNEHERALEFNLETASRAVSTYFRTRRAEAENPLKQEPEPRYCPHPKCRARLRDYNSRKGVEDKDICQNSACPTRKTEKVKKAIAKAKKDIEIAQKAADIRIAENRARRKAEEVKGCPACIHGYTSECPYPNCELGSTGW